jgi:hypothetical protein
MSGTEIVEDYSPNFEAWINDFSEWQTRIGFDPSWLGDYRFDIKFDWDTAGNKIEFGDFEGMPKWERRMQIPQQNIRDAIMSKEIQNSLVLNSKIIYLILRLLNMIRNLH